tara:strand:- start:1121 stop:1546 length:426 start_codon:yes stop_codon:yes gene_type:complete
MKLYIDKNLDIDKTKQGLIAEFCVFCSDMLPIEGDFKIYVVSERKPYQIDTTAAYILNENCCYIYGKNRAVPDVMRSIAHEMTHMMQDQTGLINGPIRDAGGFHEDQANSRAGELIKLFAKSKPERKKIYESKFKLNLSIL